MSNILLLSGVAVVVLLAIFLFLRGGRVSSARCPACLRFGRGSHYGHYRCPACGTYFWLNEVGRSVHSIWVWQSVVGPVVGVLFGAVLCAKACLETKGLHYAFVPVLALLAIAAAFKLYRVLRTKKLQVDEHTA